MHDSSAPPKELDRAAARSPADAPAVLVVDDDPMIRDILSKALGRRFRASSAQDGRQALAQLREGSFDLVLADIHMPGMSGIELLEQIVRESPDAAVIMITAVDDLDTALRTVKLGAYDYVTKPFSLEAVDACIDRALEKRTLILENRAHQQNLERLVRERTRDLEAALGRVEATYDATIKALGAALDLRDAETEHHCLRVAEYTLTLARAAGIEDPRVLKHMEWGAYLHDIGKIGVPDAILLKPGALNPEEWAVIRTHPQLGYGLLQGIDFLREAAQIVLSHHECFDGSGYPQGLRGEAIPLSARLFAVADTIDAMTSERPYREAQGIDAVSRELERLSGRQFDPRIVELYRGIPESVWGP
ncbi:MAG: response regulator [Spirochaetales bacterium]|nr:response regulator [Spirochaetales bacterium]